MEILCCILTERVSQAIKVSMDPSLVHSCGSGFGLLRKKPGGWEETPADPPLIWWAKRMRPLRQSSKYDRQCNGRRLLIQAETG